MTEIIEFQRNEYRVQGGEVHRRPADRDGLSPWDAAWLVLNHEEFIPEPVLNHQAQQRNNLRFD